MARAKGLVLETGEEGAIVLLSNGEYKRVRNSKKLHVGEIYYDKVASSYKYVAVAAIFLLMLLGTIDFFSVLAYARLSSGIELGVNRWDRIVDAKAIDSGGEQLLQGTKLQGRDLDNAIKMLLERSLETGQADKKASDGDFTVSVAVKGKADKKLQERLLLKINNVVQTTLNKRAHKGQFELLKQDDSLRIKPVNKVKEKSVRDSENGAAANSENGNNNGNSQKGADNILKNRQEQNNKDAGDSKLLVPANTTGNAKGLLKTEEKQLPGKGNKEDEGDYPEIENEKAVKANNNDKEKEIVRMIKDNKNRNK